MIEVDSGLALIQEGENTRAKSDRINYLIGDKNGSTTQAECQRHGKKIQAQLLGTQGHTQVGYFPVFIRTFRRKVPPPPNGCPHQPRNPLVLSPWASC